jgi:regulator of replication initiation timing
MREKTDGANLEDIATVHVDKNLPQSERFTEFKRQIKNVNHYKAEGFIIHAIYADNGEHVEDCLRGIMA